MAGSTSAGRSLGSARSGDIDALMTWFADAPAVASWAGPAFRFPFTSATFHEDCRWRDMASFVLRDGTGNTLAFGQMYERYGRIHLARIAVNPRCRGRGLGRELVRGLMEQGRRSFTLPEYSLFVLRDNPVAFRLYTDMGFSKRDLPKDAPMQDQYYYMTRPVERNGT